MNTSQRDKILMTIIPTLVICLAWFLWLRPEAQAWSKVDAAREAAPTPSALAVEKAKVEQLKQEERELRAAQQEWIGRWDQLRRQHQEVRTRAVTTERMAEMFRKHNLTLIREESPKERRIGSTNSLLAQVFERLRHTAVEIVPELNTIHRPGQGTAGVTHLSATAAQHTVTPVLAEEELPSIQGGPQRALWKIEFAGRYSDVQASLAELAASSSPAIPVQLIMAKSRPELTLRRWTLYIWL